MENGDGQKNRGIKVDWIVKHMEVDFQWMQRMWREWKWSGYILGLDKQLINRIILDTL